MEVYTKKGGLKKLMKDYNKEQIAKLYIAELKKNKELDFSSTIINVSATSTQERNTLQSNNDLGNIENIETNVNDLSEITSASENIILKASFSQEVCHKSDPDININSNDIGTFIEDNNIMATSVEEQRDIPNNIFHDAEANREVNKNQIQNREEPLLPKYTDVLSN